MTSVRSRASASSRVRAAVAIIVGGAESEGVAVVAGGVGPVVDLQPVDESAAGPEAMYSPVISPMEGLIFGQRQTDDDAEQGGDRHQYHKTFQQG